MAVVVTVVVLLLLLAAVCAVIAIWTVVLDLRDRASRHRPVQAAVPGPTSRRQILTVFPRRRGIAPAIALLPPPMPRRLVHATPTALVRDDDEDDDYTEVEIDDGLTTVRPPRIALRR